MKRLTTSDFINRSKEIHGDKYDYSEVEYINNSTPVKIFCKKCGKYFEQIPSSHLLGFGCKECGNKEIWNKRHKMTQEEFIESSKQINGDKCDYSLVEFKNLTTKIKLKCNKCGHIFMQLPYVHRKGQTCPKCRYETTANKLSLGKDEFIRRGKELNGDSVIYDEVEYKNNSTKVKLICPIHGEFWQTPASHLKGAGCPKCSHRSSKYTNEEFIEKLKEIYGEELDYSKEIIYNGKNNNVTLYCKKHGEFTKKASLILQGYGCPSCSFDKRSAVRISNTQDFINKAIDKNGNFLIYTKAKYVNSRTKVCITCPIHGDFWQTPNAHLRGNGCPKCGIISRVEKQKLSVDEFKQRAGEIHDWKYDYSKVHFNNVHDKAEIGCPIHGFFSQEINIHLSGCGCPKCKESKSEKEVRKLLDNKNIKYIYQYRNTDLFGFKSIDFYLPDFNTMIECQGLQHFQPVSFGGNSNKDENFKYAINNDVIKYNICKENNFKILYFIFNVKNINKDKILNIYNPNSIYNKDNLFENIEELYNNII